MFLNLLALERASTVCGDTPRNRLGGKPSAPHGRLAWPSCGNCESPMQFLAQLQSAEDADLLLVFMCQADPGCCDEWELDGGGNCVLRVPQDNLRPVKPPPGVVALPASFALETRSVHATNYSTARQQWQQTQGCAPRDLLGQLGGVPSWLQADETPECEECGELMEFVAQLEEGPADCEMNFGGGGCAYVFQCCCERDAPAKMLWQC